MDIMIGVAFLVVLFTALELGRVMTIHRVREYVAWALALILLHEFTYELQLQGYVQGLGSSWAPNMFLAGLWCLGTWAIIQVSKPDGGNRRWAMANGVRYH